MKIPQQTQEPITIDVPLGLDEPAPILVWKRNFTGGAYYENCFLTRDGCLSAEKSPEFDWVGRLDEPIQLTLLSVIAHARSTGAHSVIVRDDNLRVIEEYPL